MLERVIDLVDRESDLRGVGLDARFADIGDQGIDEPILLLDEHLAQSLQLDPTGLDVAQDPGAKPGLEILDDVGNAIDGSHPDRLDRQLG